jgi:hypothetical protein
VEEEEAPRARVTVSGGDSITDGYIRGFGVVVVAQSGGKDDTGEMTRSTNMSPVAR